ncbi:MAG: hypothetical protein LBE09_04295 [Christensenellaceae bacterium]|jgi:hypothetical protein|nr:hypothetical protein [Christensenellaceae bacterium]
MDIWQCASKIRVVETSNRLKGKIVAFVGTFSAGTIQVKDLVYAAGGAPSDNIPVFADYVVVCHNGKNAQMYKKASKMIQPWAIREITEADLRIICSGEISAPERAPMPKDRNVIEYHDPDD